MKNFLSTSERLTLREAHLAERNKRRADRLKTILLLDEGWSYPMIAKALLLDDATCRRYLKEYQEGGLDALLEDDYQGGSSKLSALQEDELKAHLRETVYYTAKEVAAYVEKEYGISYTTEGMVHLLHRLGFTYKKLTKIPGKADIEKQKAFLQLYEELKEQKKQSDRIYFMDGVHPQHNIVGGRAWILKGEEKEIKTNTGRKRVNLNGAFNVEDQEVIIRQDDTINAQSTIYLFKEIESKHPESRTIYVIADNAKYYRSKIVKKYLITSRIKLIFLPPYAPNLNLIERLWKYFHKKVRRKYYEAYDDFQRACLDFFKNIKDHKEELESLITEKFHLIGEA